MMVQLEKMTLASISLVLGIAKVLSIISTAMCDSSMDEYMENSPSSIKAVGRSGMTASNNETKSAKESKNVNSYDDHEHQYRDIELDLYGDPDPSDETNLVESYDFGIENETVTRENPYDERHKDKMANAEPTTSTTRVATATNDLTLQPFPANTSIQEDVFQTTFEDFQGDLMGWRKVDIREFPYVVSLMHEKYRVHICTGTLLTSKVVLSYTRCVVRRKSVADKVVYTVAEAYQIIVAAGLTSHKNLDENAFVFRYVELIITTYDNAFKGHLVFLMLEKEVPYSIYHRPVKLYSMDLKILGLKLQEHVGNSFCEVITWEDTIICSNSKIKRPKGCTLEAVNYIYDTSPPFPNFMLELSRIADLIFVNPSTITRCGSAPGGPIVCGNSVYGIMSLGTSCSEFGDYTHFIPLNSTEMYLLYEQTIELKKDDTMTSFGCLKTANRILIILLFYASLRN